MDNPAWPLLKSGRPGNHSMKHQHALLLAFSLLGVPQLHSQDEAEVTRLLMELKNPDAEARREAIAGLQTSLDPRIPVACLPLFELEGDSVRRLAARAIGSRWHQIPKEGSTVFTAVLKAQLKSDHDGLVNMARRGLALLNRNYTDAMVSRSKSKRWVIYERRGLPCLIDTKTMTEELLGFPFDGWMACSWGNGELAPTVMWHPKSEMVAMDMLESRKTSTIWVWAHGTGLRQLSFEAQLKALGVKEDAIARAAGFFTEMSGWSGESLEYTLSYSVVKGDDYVDHEAALRWNPISGKIIVLSVKVI